MTKEEYLHEKRVLDEQLGTIEEDIERIEEELTRVPTREDLENLEEMASRVRGFLGTDINIPDQDKRTIMEMLNLRVIVALDKRMKVAGWFTPQNGLLSTSQSSRQGRKLLDKSTGLM